MKKIRTILLAFVLGCTTGVMAQEDKVYEVVQTMPMFPGGQTALYAYLQDNMKYPPEALQDGIEGRVVCKFIVEPDGSISGMRVLRSSGNEYLDAEAVRLVGSMPEWIPGEQGGQRVRVAYTMPIKFRLPE